MTQVANLMADETEEADFCTYTTVKIDDQVIPFIKAAAALAGLSVQEYVSNHMNEIAAKALRNKPIKRRPAPQRKKSD